MKRALLDFLNCPDCKGDLRIDAVETQGDAVETGSLVCSRCAHSYSILKGIPRFLDAIGSADDLRKVYADSFGHQWTTYQWLRDVDPDEFYTITDFTPETFRLKTVLDAGCGGGRVARFVAPLCGEFIGFDYSIAVEKAAELCRGVENAHFVQCDVNRHPFKPNTFDVVYSHGVLHHTPSTKRSFDNLPPLVKPGGVFYVAVFRKSFEPLQWSDTLWRNVLNRLPISAMDKVCDVMSYLRFTPFARQVKRFFWFSLERTKEIRKCCLYDWYGPRYHHEHTVEEVFGWFRSAGFPAPKYIDAWPYCPAEQRYQVPGFRDSFRLGQLLGVVATKGAAAPASAAGANGGRERESASTAATRTVNG